jgi:hypothetical protein
MYRARTIALGIPTSYDWYCPKIRFINLPRESIDIIGPFETQILNLAKLAARRAGMRLAVGQSRVIMPVHELQLDLILSSVPEAEPLEQDICVPAKAQASIR